MVSCHPLLSISATKQSPFFGSKISNIQRTTFLSKNGYSCSQNKIQFTIVSKQNRNHNDVDDVHIRHAKALKEVKHILGNKVKQSAIEGLSMIDSIQRLGIEYHFEEEIHAVLQRQPLMFGSQSYCGNNDHELSEVALQFRLLRQEGYWFHANVFDNFMDNEGKLEQKFWGDTEGLTGLFEASQLSIEGENFLDEAENLSRKLLNAWMSRFPDRPQAKAIANTLQYPIHKSLTKFMPTSPQLKTSGWTSSLQEQSKLDTHIISSLQLEEISAVSRWLEELGLAKDLKFAKMNQLNGTCAQRHGSRLHTFRRWDLEAMEKLPDYMKASFKALYDTTNEFALKVQIKHGWNPRDILIKSWKTLCNAFLVEAKWFGSGNFPVAEDYLKNGILSSGIQMLIVHAFSLMGEGINKKTVSLMDGFPSLISSTASILRLHDDLEAIKNDNQDVKDWSYLKCYMKDHPEVSSEQTVQLVNQKLSDSWKPLNKDRLITPTNPFPPSFAQICVSIARVVPLI